MKTPAEAADNFVKDMRLALDISNYSVEDALYVGFKKGFESRQPEVDALKAELVEWRALGVETTQAKIDAALAERDASTPPKAMCMDCHKDYSEFGLDTVMPDDQWAVVNPDINGLLCAQCIVNRASKLDGIITVKLTLDYRNPSPNPISGDK